MYDLHYQLRDLHFLVIFVPNILHLIVFQFIKACSYIYTYHYARKHSSDQYAEGKE